MNKLFEWDGGVSNGYIFNYLMLNFPLPPSFDKWNWYVFKNALEKLLSLLVVQPAQIISGFISFGTLHIHTSSFEPWQW